MEKISGIVPSTARIQSVNLKDGPTMRPGAPSFGAPRGKAAINGGAAPTTAQKAVAAHNELMARRSGDAHKPEIIRDMADRFFLKNQSGPGELVEDLDVNFQMDLDSPTPYVPGAEAVQVEPIAPEYLAVEPVSSEPQYVMEEPIQQSSVDESEEYTPPGSYLDVSV